MWLFVVKSYFGTKIKRPIWAFDFCAEIGVRTRKSHDSGVGSTMSRFCKHSAAKPSGMPHSPAICGAREYFISARNIPLHRRGVFIYKNGEGSATFPPQGYQYVQRSYQIIEYPHRLHTTAKTTVAILVFLTLKTIISAKVSCVLFMGFPMSLLTSEHKQV